MLPTGKYPTFFWPYWEAFLQLFPHVERAFLLRFSPSGGPFWACRPTKISAGAHGCTYGYQLGASGPAEVLRDTSVTTSIHYAFKLWTN